MVSKEKHNNLKRTIQSQRLAHEARLNAIMSGETDEVDASDRDAPSQTFTPEEFCALMLMPEAKGELEHLSGAGPALS